MPSNSASSGGPGPPDTHGMRLVSVQTRSVQNMNKAVAKISKLDCGIVFSEAPLALRLQGVVARIGYVNCSHVNAVVQAAFSCGALAADLSSAPAKGAVEREIKAPGALAPILREAFSGLSKFAGGCLSAVPKGYARLILYGEATQVPLQRFKCTNVAASAMVSLLAQSMPTLRPTQLSADSFGVRAPTRVPKGGLLQSCPAIGLSVTALDAPLEASADAPCVEFAAEQWTALAFKATAPPDAAPGSTPAQPKAKRRRHNRNPPRADDDASSVGGGPRIKPVRADDVMRDGVVHVPDTPQGVAHAPAPAPPETLHEVSLRAYRVPLREGEAAVSLHEALNRMRVLRGVPYVTENDVGDMFVTVQSVSQADGDLALRAGGWDILSAAAVEI